MITLKQLRHLQAIILHGSIHAAAKAQHLTPPALTRSIGALEHALGMALFERRGTGMLPTDFCLQIASRCQQVLLEIQDIQREASLYRSLGSGELHIGVGRGIKEWLIRETLPEFAAHRPQISVTVSDDLPEDLVYSLKQREVDFLLVGVGSYRDTEGISIERLKDIPLSIITSAQHPLAKRKKAQPQALKAYPLIAPTAVSGPNTLRSLLSEFGAEQQSTTSIICSDHTTLKSILLKTDAWLIASELLFLEELKKGELCKLDLTHPALVIELGVIELRGRSRSPAATEFIRLCHDFINTHGLSPAKPL